MRLRAHQVVNELIVRPAGFANRRPDLHPISHSPIHRKSFWDITLRLSEVYLMAFVSIVNWSRENFFVSFRGLQPKFFSTYDPKNFGLLPTSTTDPKQPIVEKRGVEPLTLCLQSRCSTN